MYEIETKRQTSWLYENMFYALHIEILNINFCKYVLRVNKKASFSS